MFLCNIAKLVKYQGAKLGLTLIIVKEIRMENVQGLHGFPNDFEN